MARARTHTNYHAWWCGDFAWISLHATVAVDEKRDVIIPKKRSSACTIYLSFTFTIVYHVSDQNEGHCIYVLGFGLLGMMLSPGTSNTQLGAAKFVFKREMALVKNQIPTDVGSVARQLCVIVLIFFISFFVSWAYDLAFCTM